MKHRKFWTLWDADDTILGVEIEGEVRGTGYAYEYTIERFADRMEQEGFARDLAKLHQHEIDMGLCKRFGFADKGRFPQSMVSAYEMLCAVGVTEPQAGVADEVRKIGFQVFDFPYRALPGALETLATVAKQYNVAIVTKGEHAEQNKKVFDTGLFVYADQVIVLGHKSHDEWERVLDTLRIDLPTRTRSWAIGNSIKSDVNPPLELGLNGLHLDGYSWAFEDAELAAPLVGRQAHTIHDIRDVLKYVPISTQEITHAP